MAQKQNLYSLGNNGGHPPIYKTPAELEKKVEEYFTYCIENKTHIAITGLVLFLGFAHRQSLTDYQNRAEFSDIIKRARTVVELSYEQDLRTFKYGGAVFALKNMGWFDKQEIDHTTKGNAIDGGLNKLSNLPPEDLMTMHAIMKKAGIETGEKQEPPADQPENKTQE